MVEKNILHYKVLEKLGEGGMGIVYKAHDTKLSRDVAIKVLPPHMLVSEDDRSRFNREAKAAAALHHPHIATVFEINEFDGKPFIVMEYIEGQTLNHFIEKKPFKIEEAVTITIQIAEALQAAHDKDIVHRDIKSSNILLSTNKRAKVLDFGLAKTSMSTKLTQMGTTIGTVAYMSPEQVNGKEVDHRTDLWSLGVVLYEMAAGRLPYMAEYDQAIFYSIQNEEPEPLTAVRSGVPMALEWIVSKLMAKDPNERYQNAKDLIIDLKAIDLTNPGMSRISQTVQKSIPAKPAISQNIKMGRNILPWVLFSLSTLIVLILLWGLGNGNDDPGISAFFKVDLPQEEVLDIAVYTAIDISPDGTKIVFRSGNQLFLRNLNQLNVTAIPNTYQASSPFFSPDGNWIGFFSEGALKKISLNGESPIIMAEAGDNRGATWGANGDIVFSPITVTGLWHVSAIGGNAKQISFPDTLRNERTHRWPHFLPDGKTVLYTVGFQDSPDYYEEAEIHALNIETGEHKLVLKGASTAKFIPDKLLIFSRQGVLYAVEFDAEDIEITGTPANVMDKFNGDATSGAMHYSISQKGTLAYIPGLRDGDKRRIIKISLDGEIIPLDAPVNSYYEPRISPDGKRLALVIGNIREYDIWIYDLIDKNLSRFTFEGINRTPIWSADGSLISYFSPVDGKGYLKVKKSDGSGQEKILTETINNRAYINGWTTDGKTLIFDTYTPSEQSNMMSYAIGQNKKFKTIIGTEADEYMGSLSPDGKWFAYASNESGPYQIYVRPFPISGGKWQVSNSNSYEPKWSHDMKSIFYTTGSNLIQVPISTENGAFKMGTEKIISTKYAALPVDSGITYDVDPKGKFIITTMPAVLETNKSINVIVNWKAELNKIFTQ